MLTAAKIKLRKETHDILTSMRGRRIVWHHDCQLYAPPVMPMDELTTWMGTYDGDATALRLEYWDCVHQFVVTAPDQP